MLLFFYIPKFHTFMIKVTNLTIFLVLKFQYYSLSINQQKFKYYKNVVICYPPIKYQDKKFLIIIIMPYFVTA